MKIFEYIARCAAADIECGATTVACVQENPDVIRYLGPVGKTLLSQLQTDVYPPKPGDLGAYMRRRMMSDAGADFCAT